MARVRDTLSDQYENNVVQWLEGQQDRQGSTAKGRTGFKDQEVVSVPRSRKMRPMRVYWFPARGGH